MLRQKIQISQVQADSNVTIHFNSNYNLSGLSEDIDNLVTAKTTDSINETSDEEKVRFIPSTSYTLTASFYNATSHTYVNNVAPNEFALTAQTTVAFLTSFYVYKVFDSTNENSQNLIHTGYLNGYNFNGFSNSSYSWTTFFEYSDIHIPISYLDTITASTFNLYLRLYFYSAKSGHVYPFSGLTNTSQESNLYNVLTFNKSTLRYSVTTPYSFKEIVNVTYSNIVNDSVDSLAIGKPNYPSGNTFTTQGIYTTI